MINHDLPYRPRLVRSKPLYDFPVSLSVSRLYHHPRKIREAEETGRDEADRSGACPHDRHFRPKKHRPKLFFCFSSMSTPCPCLCGIGVCVIVLPHSCASTVTSKARAWCTGVESITTRGYLHSHFQRLNKRCSLSNITTNSRFSTNLRDSNDYSG